MEQAKVTDYFKSRKRSNNSTNKQLKSSKDVLLNSGNVEESWSNFDFVCSLKSPVLRKSTRRNGKKLKLSHEPAFTNINNEKEQISRLESESTPKCRGLNTENLNSASVKSNKIRKQKSTNKNLLSTPSTASLNGRETKLVSPCVRKRLLLQDDSAEAKNPCKILKCESSGSKQTARVSSLTNHESFLRSEIYETRHSEKNFLPKVSELQKNDDKDLVAEEKLKARDDDLSKLSHLKAKVREAKEKLVELKDSQTQIYNVPEVSEEPEKDDKKDSVKEEKMKAIREKLLKINKLKDELKVIQEKQTEVKKQYSNETPAYQKYHYLAIKPSKSLPLPFKYKSLEEIFQSVDRVVSLLHNRHEVCTFGKLKHSVQEMTKRAFNKTHLGQIKTVFPLAYEFSLEKNLSTLSTEGSNGDCQLTITPNFDYTESIKSDSVGFLCNQLRQTDIHKAYGSTNKTPNKPFVTMNSTCLLERQFTFNCHLLEMAKRYHEQFLANLNPSVHVPSNKILRWHPRFPLDDVPDILVASLPEPLDKNYPTAKDVLKLIKDKVEAKVENALHNITEKYQEIQIPHPKPNHNELVKQGALKGISQALLEKIRAREALRMQRVMTRQPDVEKRLEMISRFPELVNILRTYFITVGRAAVAVSDVSKKLSESYQSHLTSENAEQHLYLMADLLPEWISIITISKGPFVKIDKNKELKIVIEKINQLIKQES